MMHERFVWRGHIANHVLSAQTAARYRRRRYLRRGVANHQLVRSELQTLS